jgi:hypothetical protein
MARTLFEIKKLFFDKPAVQQYINKKTNKVLGMFGGSVRKVATRSMRVKPYGKFSAPGVPPYAHGQQLIRKLYYYSLDPIKKSVVVGPVGLLKYRDAHVPRTHEQGGTITRRTKHHGVKTFHYPPRPFTKPAAQLMLPKVAGWYARA